MKNHSYYMLTLVVYNLKNYIYVCILFFKKLKIIYESLSSKINELMSTELVMSSNHLILCCSFLLLPSIFPNIRVFSNELALCIRWPNYWSFSFSISPSNEYSGLISFMMNWFDLVVQHTILQHSAFFMVQLSHIHI